MGNVLFVCLFYFMLQGVNDPVLEKRCIKIDARDISISFRRKRLFIIFWDDPKNRRERKGTQSKITTLCGPPRPLRLIFFLP